MATTTWLPKHQTERTFITNDGRILETPRLEQTSTGRKIRLASTNQHIPGAPQSWYASTHEESLQKVIEAAAVDMGTTFWMTTPRSLNPERPSEFHPGEVNVAHAWWHFKHPLLPIESIVRIKVVRNSSVNFEISTEVTVPDTRPKTWSPVRWTADDEHFHVVWARLNSGPDYKFRDWQMRHHPEWTENVLGSETFTTERMAVNEMRRRVAKMENRDSIEIPDLRNLDEGKSDAEFAWLDLDLVGSSVNGAFLSDMNEYLTEGGNVDRTRGIYLELVESFRSLGMVMANDVSDSDFMRALLAGDTKALTVRIGFGIDDKGDDDKSHVVSLHLPTGTLVVDCKHTAAKPDEVALHWEESLFRAQITGKQNLLLAYAKEYVSTKHETRTSQIVTDRIENQRIN